MQSAESISGIAENSLSKDELFLTNGFKLIFSQKFTKYIVDWFTNKFMVIYRADSMQLIKRFADPKKKAIFGTTGDKGVRKHEDYMGKYFISQYGAIKDIDFTQIFEELFDRGGEV